MKEGLMSNTNDYQLAEESFATIEQAADFMNVKANTIRIWVMKRAKSKIPYYQAGNRLRFRLSELASWMKRN